MNKSITNLLDLPDELLLIIFKHLNFIEVINSFFDINERFDRIICDHSMTKTLDFSSMIFFDNQIFDRLGQLLPRICQNIKYLIFRSISQEWLLHLADHPNLYKLDLGDINLTETKKYFDSNDSPLVKLIQKQITHLSLTPKDNTLDELISMTDFNDLYLRVFQYSTNVTHLEFNTDFTPKHFSFRPSCDYLPFGNSLSSTIVYLSIRVFMFDDLLFLLTGCLPRMHTLIVISDLHHQFYSRPITVDQTVSITYCLHSLF